MKKILFMTHSYALGGAELLVKSICTTIDKNIFQSEMYGPIKGELCNLFDEEGINYHIKDFYVEKINRERDFLINNRTKQTLKKIIKNAKKNNKKIAIRCAGTIASKMLNDFNFSDVNLIGLFDNNETLLNHKIKGYPIFKADKLSEYKPDIVIIAHSQPAFFKNEIIELLGNKTEIVNDLFVVTGIEKLRKIFTYYLNLKAPLSFIKNINPDIVFVNNAQMFWAVLVSKILGKKVIWSIHESFDAKTWNIFPHFLFLKTLSMADKYVFPAWDTYSYYKNYINKDKVRIIPYGLDYEKIKTFKTDNNADKLKEKLNISHNHKVISIIGKVEDRKGQLNFIKAAIKLLDSREDKDITFVIVGDVNNDYSEKINTVINQSSYKDNFRIIEMTKNVYQYFLISDIFVCCSIVEAFPVVILEAMAFEKPIISTNICGIPEEITHNESGILIPLDNIVDNLKDKLNELLDNPKQMKMLSINAYERFINDYTLDKMITSFENELELL